MNHDVFISYSSKDKTTALAICHVLEEHRIRCWMAPRDIPPGADYGDVIDEAIVGCRLFVLVFSGPAALSQWVKGELNLAFTERKIIIPYRIDETPLKGAMRLILNQTHWIEAYPDAEARFGELVEAAERFLGRPVSTELKTESVPTAASGSVASETASALPKTYKVGDYYHENGKKGIVFEVDAAGRHGKIMAMHDLPEELAWCTDEEYEKWEEADKKIGAVDEQDGMKNLEVVRRIPGWREKYPAFAACAALGEGWYLPAWEELIKLYDNRLDLSAQTEKFGGSPFVETRYWSSSEYTPACAWFVNFIYDSRTSRTKTNQYRARAVAVF